MGQLIWMLVRELNSISNLTNLNTKKECKKKICSSF
jgi:hypothetical protein